MYNHNNSFTFVLVNYARIPLTLIIFNFNNFIMRKQIVLTAMLALSSLAVCSQTLNILSFGEGTGPGQGEPGMMGWGISPNGKYVCGPLEYAAGYFVGDLSSGKFLYTPTDDDEGAYLGNINNNGTAIGFNGPGVTVSIDGTETILKVPSTEYKYIVGHDLTDDGSTLVGDLVGTGYLTTAAYSADGGKWTSLPFPDESVELGIYDKKISTALYISGDGKYILGTTGTLGPAMMWVLNEKGEYEADPIFKDYLIVDRDKKDKPLISFKAENISSNGKYVLLSVQKYADGEISKPMAAIFKTETRELDIYSDDQEIDPYGIGLTPLAIADDGTFIGLIGTSIMNYGTFIMKSGARQAQSYAQAFPDYTAIWANLDVFGYHVATGISADGKKIIGNGWYSEEPENNDSAFYFMTYVLDLSENSGIDGIQPEESEGRPVAIYTVDGLKVPAPVKGLNIILMDNGKVKKVMK